MRISGKFTQELQALAATADGRFNIIGGLFYFDEAARQTLRDEFGPRHPRPCRGAAAADVAARRFQELRRLYAGGLQADRSPDPHRRTALYARQQDIRRSIQNGFAPPAALANVAYGLKANVVTPKANNQYELAAHTNIYATVSRGYRSGSFYGLIIADPSTYGRPYNAEFAWSYEAGLKAELFDRKLRLNTLRISRPSTTYRRQCC